MNENNDEDNLFSDNQPETPPAYALFEQPPGDLGLFDEKEPSKTFIIVGKTGSGKSSLINCLYNVQGSSRRIEVSDDNKPCSSVFVIHNYRHHKIIDTPGLGDAEVKDGLTIEYFISMILPKEISGVFLLINFMENLQESLRKNLNDYVTLFKGFSGSVRLIITKIPDYPLESNIKGILAEMCLLFNQEFEMCLFNYPKEFRNPIQNRMNSKCIRLINNWMNKSSPLKLPSLMINALSLRPRLNDFIKKIDEKIINLKYEITLLGQQSRLKSEAETYKYLIDKYNTDDLVITDQKTYRVKHNSANNRTYRIQLSSRHKIADVIISMLRPAFEFKKEIDETKHQVIINWRTNMFTDVYFDYVMLSHKKDYFEGNIQQLEGKIKLINKILDQLPPLSPSENFKIMSESLALLESYKDQIFHNDRFRNNINTEFLIKIIKNQYDPITMIRQDHPSIII